MRKNFLVYHAIKPKAMSSILWAKILLSMLRYSWSIQIKKKKVSHSRLHIHFVINKLILISFLFYVFQLSNQKQITSWTALDKLSSKVVYDFNSKEYVGVFGRKWIRCWSADCSDINKIKKIKVNSFGIYRNVFIVRLTWSYLYFNFQLSKPANSLVSIENVGTVVLYMDGTCESLEYAIETRKEKKDLSLLQFKPIIDPTTVDILSSTFFKGSNDSILFTFFVKSRDTRETNLIYYKIDNETLRIDGPVNRLKLLRDEKNIRLCGFTVVDSSSVPNLVTICKWSILYSFKLNFMHLLFENIWDQNFRYKSTRFVFELHLQGLINAFLWWHYDQIQVRMRPVTLFPC